MADLRALEAVVAGFESSSTKQGAKATAARKTTTAEVDARDALAKELRAIRADVADAAPGDVELQEAFGRGAELAGKTTNPLLEAADLVAGSFTARAEDVKKAGVTAARIAKLAKLRAALADADVTQRGALGDKKVASGAKAADLGAIKKGVAALRKRLGGARASAALATTSARRTVKKRAPRPTAAEKATKSSK